MQAVIFDMDGTLLDTERLALDAFRVVARQLGGHIRESLFVQAIGRGEEDARAIFLTELGQQFPYDELIERVTELIHQACDRGAPHKEGVTEIFQYLQSRQIPFAVATSTNHVSARKRLEVAGLLPHVEALVGGDEITNGKPAPDIYLEAARRLQTDPATCVAIEDSGPGIRAARAANMRAVLVPDVAPTTADMQRHATVVLPSLLDVIDWLKGAT